VLIRMPQTRAKNVKTSNADCIPPFWLDVKALQRALLEAGFYLGDMWRDSGNWAC